jgi:CHAD domain-containing protein
MSYRLDPTDNLPNALRAVVAEQIEDAVRVLREDRAKDPVEAVHDARKDLKKARSVLRLARVGMLPKRRAAANARMRDVAAQLSDVRDADVMVETVDALRDHFAGRLPRRTFTIVRQRFVKAALASRAAADEAISEELLGELAAIRADVIEWPLAACTPVSLAEGAQIAYRRGRARFAEARADPTTESLHEWRKRVKDLWYHARLLEEAWPPVLAAFAEEAHTLSDHLGDEHDLGVLAERLGAGTWPPSVDGPALLALVAERRAELRQLAWVLGDKLYSEKPGAFGARMATYLTSR